MKKITLLSALVLGAFSFVATVDAAEYTSNGSVTFEASTDPTDPVDPTDPTKPVDPTDPTDPNGPNPGTPGPLSIDFASSLDFGTQKITSADQTYTAAAQEVTGATGTKEVPNYVQVTDNRGTGAGWTLTLTQTEQFATAADQMLTGAEVSFANGSVVTASEAPAPSVVGGAAFTLAPGTAQPIMAAATNEGLGTYLMAWGTDATSAAESIELFVPGSTTKYATEYKTTFNWSLTDVPGNN